MASVVKTALIPLAVITQPWLTIWNAWTRPQNSWDASNFVCNHMYTTELVSISPLAIYINNFISDWEIGYLRNLAESNGLYEYSEAHDPNRVYAPLRRTSSSAILPDEDVVVRCIDERAERFAGFIDHEKFESIQLVKYLESERHDPHFDWFPYPKKLGNGLTCNRASSFFVYLGGNCTGGETYFESLNPAPPGTDPAKFVNTNSGDGLGLAVRPIKGNAMFWMNLHANNTGDERVRHSAMPIKSGVKHGMNLLMKRCFEA